jgi:hypothetical protein
LRVVKNNRLTLFSGLISAIINQGMVIAMTPVLSENGKKFVIKEIAYLYKRKTS